MYIQSISFYQFKLRKIEVFMVEKILPDDMPDIICFNPA